MPNIVEVTVRSRDETKAGYDAAERGSKVTAGKIEETFAQGGAEAGTRFAAELNRKAGNVPVGIDIRKAGIDVDALSGKIAEMARKAASVPLSMNDTKARVTLLNMTAKLDDLGRKVVEPQITLGGRLRALAQITEIGVALDKLDAKKPSLLSRVAGLIPGVGGGAGGAGGAGASAGVSGAGQAAAGAAPLLSNPYALAGGAAVAIAALPFIAQAAASGITLALGGALAGLGIAGALQSKKVQKSFSDLKDSATKDLGTIGKSFIPVLESIAGTASKVLAGLTPVLAGAVKSIAVPFQAFADALIKAFGQPAVKQAIQAVAGAFGDILKALTPQLPGMITNIAAGVKKIADAVAANPRAFADFVKFLVAAAGAALTAIAWLTKVAVYIEQHFGPAMHRTAVIFDGVRHEIAHIWDMIFQNSIGMVIRLGHNVETQFNSVRHQTAVIFDGVRHDIAHIWDLIFSNTIGSVIRIGHNVATQFNSIRHSIAVIYDGVRHDIAHVWDVIWNNTVGRVQRGISDVLSFFRGLPGRVVSAIGNLSSTLAGKGGDLIRGLLSGITGALRNIAGWVNSNIVQPIIGAVKRFFGISSPSTVFAGIGGHLVGGLIKGLITSGKGLASIIPKVFGSMPRALLQLLEKGIGGITSLPGKAVSALKGLGGHALDVLSGIGNLATGIWDKLFGGGGGGSGVQRWRPLVLHALAMEHLPASYAGLVLDQMQSESGGNPRAQNNTDINAQRGDPSRGLLQTIGSTFAAYHWPGTSNDIFNPLANIAAAINYSAHGRGFGRGPGQMGSMHGYGAGGIGGGWATVGEYGRELVRLPHGSHVYPHSQVAMAGAGAPAGKLQIEWIGGNASDEFITWLRKNIRIRGGDVQSVLGWG